jgi:membrane protease YdiL (CAAX protease family)
MSPGIKKDLKIVIIYIAMWFAVLVMQVIIAIPYIDSNGDIVMTVAQELRLISISNLVLYLSLFIIFTYVLRSYLKEQFIHTKNNLHDYIKLSLLGVLGLFVVVFLSAIVMDLLGVTENSENQEILNDLVTAAMFDKISLIVFTVFFAPFAEEIVFRKAVYGLFERINIPLAIIVSGLSFGLIHVMSGDLIQLIIYGSLGLVLAYVYYYSKKNLLTVITIHMIYNLIITIFMFS